MKDVIVATSYTHEAGLLHAYRQSLIDAGIDYSFDQVSTATSSFNMRRRIDYWRELAQKHIDYKAIIITDGWDVLFIGKKEQLLKKAEMITALKVVLISGEQNCFPGPEYGEEDYTHVIKGPTRWKYSNPGMVIANPQTMLEWLHKAEDLVPLDISDQAWFNRQLAKGNPMIQLDYSCNLFYVISYNDGRFENGSIQIKDGMLWNADTGMHPCFFHFAGHGPDESLRILPGRGYTKYATQEMIRTYIQFK